MNKKTYKFNIYSKYEAGGSEIIYVAELDVVFKDMSYPIQLGEAVKIAVKEGADLTGADLEGAIF